MPTALIPISAVRGRTTASDHDNRPNSNPYRSRNKRTESDNNNTATANPDESPTNNNHHRKRSSGGAAAFRGSILRDLVPHHQSQQLNEEQQPQITLGADDIRASPRLLGYLFGMIVSAVMFVSLVRYVFIIVAYSTVYYLYVFFCSMYQLIYVYVWYFFARFYNLQQVGWLETYKRIVSGTDEFFPLGNTVVYRWKLIGSWYIAGVGCLSNFAALAVHFDTHVAPALWNRIFHNGSPWERAWIYFWCVYWAIGVHVNTSSLSVGEHQANVFLTTWLAFAASLVLVRVWREQDEETHDRTFKRETTHNWIWTAAFSAIFAGSVTDMYYNRNTILFQFQGKTVNVSDKAWVILLSSVWGEFLLDCIAIFCNEFFARRGWTCKLPCRYKRKDDVMRCVFGWRQIEGLLMAVSLGAKFYVSIISL
jgi:hypothetical protein